MKNVLLISVLTVFNLTVLSADVSQQQYERLTDKLVKAEKEMYKAYKNTGKSLEIQEKRKLRSEQYTWKFDKVRKCTKSSMNEKARLSCKYKKVVSRINYLKHYNPEKKVIKASEKEIVQEKIELKLYNSIV